MCLIYCQMSFYARDICVLINFISDGSSSLQSLMVVSQLQDHGSEGAVDIRIYNPLSLKAFGTMPCILWDYLTGCHFVGAHLHVCRAFSINMKPKYPL